jgi:hypothetical protein
MKIIILVFFCPLNLHSPFVLWIILFETNEEQGVNTPNLFEIHIYLFYQLSHP